MTRFMKLPFVTPITSLGYVTTQSQPCSRSQKNPFDRLTSTTHLKSRHKVFEHCPVELGSGFLGVLSEICSKEDVVWFDVAEFFSHLLGVGL